MDEISDNQLNIFDIIGADESYKEHWQDMPEFNQKKYSTLSTNNRLEFAESLVEQHPDVAKVVWRYDRWHHEVNYDLFKKNKLIFKKDYKKKIGVNNYNMKLIKLNK